MLDFLGSLVQPAARLIDRATARPRIGSHFDWIQHAGSPVLRFFFINNGRRRGAIVDIRFRTDATPIGQGWTRQHAIMDRLPVTLEPHTASTAFELTTDSPTEEFDRLLREGRDHGVRDRNDGETQPPKDLPRPPATTMTPERLPEDWHVV